ncbi:Protein CASC3 [Holothuria leucospilota]|uniref:Protein CASC3 n=1 Tax=Holothuria leucospilota TaxID=206669 RepID=A0A9Q0YB91_HOLLE|nr:Protein CASC3 [Holothuria leucospilota]
MSESDGDKIPQRPGRRRRRQHEDGATSDSGGESDTIFEEVSEYESAEDHESEEEDETAGVERGKEETVDDGNEIDAIGEDEVLVAEVANLHITGSTEKSAAQVVSGDEADNEEEEKERIEDVEDYEEEETGEAVDTSTIGEPQDEEIEEEAEIEEDVDEEETDIKENKEDEDLEEKRGSGDGQEEPSEEGAVELDDDEDLKNPAYIPRKGAYYQHDVRMGDDYKSDKKQKRERRLWKGDDNKWLHDKYDESQQAPKSQYEIVNYYGFDIRDPTQQGRMERDGYDRRRGRGRGGRGGRRDGPPRGRGRGRGIISRSVEEDGSGDRGQQREQRSYYNSSKTTERRNYERDADFPQLPTRGQGDENKQNSKPTLTYAERVSRGQHRSHQIKEEENDNSDYEEDENSVRIPYQSEKTYYEKDSGGHKEESFKNVSSDYRYQPSRGQSNPQQVYLSEGSAPTAKYHRDTEAKSYSHSYSEHSRRRTQPGSREKDYGEQSQPVYPLEFVNKNYQRDAENQVNSSSLRQQGEIHKEEELPEPQGSSRKAYSMERHQRSRGQMDSSEVTVQEAQTIPIKEEGKVESKNYMHLRNLKIQVKGSERTVLYHEDDEDEKPGLRTNQQDIDDEEDQENQRNDRRERSRPKRYSSQRQRGQDLPQATSQQFYPQGYQGAGDPSRSKGDVPPHQASHPHPQRTSGQGHLSRQQGGGSPGVAPPTGLPQASSSLSPSIQNLMQQGMIMPPEDPMSQGVRPPHLPSPAFFQQHQGNLPPPYYVGPMVNYGAPQYPMGTPLQFQHYPIGMPHSPQGGVPPPAAPAAPPPPPPQNAAVPSSSQNPSVQQVGGVTYYSPMQQPPPQMRHLPPKRQSKPLTIESPP